MNTIAPPALTLRQHQVLHYLRNFLRMNHQLPPCDQIARDFGWASPNSASSHLVFLEKKGYLERNELGRLMISPAGMAAVEQLA